MRIAKKLFPCHTTQKRKTGKAALTLQKKNEYTNFRLRWKNDIIPQAFISKSDPNATSLFNYFSKPVLSPLLKTNPNGLVMFSETIPVQSFYGWYFKNAQHSKTYTAHCFRATAIQGKMMPVWKFVATCIWLATKMSCLWVTANAIARLNIKKLMNDT